MYPQNPSVNPYRTFSQAVPAPHAGPSAPGGGFHMLSTVRATVGPRAQWACGN